MRVSVVFVAVFMVTLFVACTHKAKVKQVTGCMDVFATNYNPNATVNAACTYKIDEIAGAYYVHDTAITFHHNDTTGLLDTSYSQFVMHAVAYSKDSFDFDTVLCIFCRGGYHSIASDMSHYNYAFDAYYYYYSGGGTFKGDTLTYYDGVSPMNMEGATRRFGVAIKQH